MLLVNKHCQLHNVHYGVGLKITLRRLQRAHERCVKPRTRLHKRNNNEKLIAIRLPDSILRRYVWYRGISTVLIAALSCFSELTYCSNFLSFYDNFQRYLCHYNEPICSDYIKHEICIRIVKVRDYKESFQNTTWSAARVFKVLKYLENFECRNYFHSFLKGPYLFSYIKASNPFSCLKISKSFIYLKINEPSSYLKISKYFKYLKISKPLNLFQLKQTTREKQDAKVRLDRLDIQKENLRLERDMLKRDLTEVSAEKSELQVGSITP